MSPRLSSPRYPELLRFLACAGVAVLLAGCGKQQSPDAAKGGPGGPGGGAPPAMPVTVQKVESQRVPISLEAVGQAEGSREIEVRARVSGIIEKRTYTEGAPVAPGTTLFVIEQAPYEIAVQQAQAALGQEVARQEQAQRETDRLKSLAQQKAISQREYDETVSTLKQSTAAIAGAQARLAEAKLNLSYTNVKAPIGGITGRALRSEGSLVSPTSEASLLTLLTQVDPVWVRFSLPEREFERIRGSQRGARVQILDDSGKVAADNGRLNFSGSTVDPKLGTVQMRAEFANPGNKWLPGQFVKVQIQAGEQQGFLVPQAAVMQSEQGYAVWVVDAQNKAEMRPVKPGSWVGNNWIITDGLKPGEAVIVDNLMKVRPGAPVQPMEPGAKPAAGAPPGPANGAKPAAAAPAAPAR